MANTSMDEQLEAIGAKIAAAKEKSMSPSSLPTSHPS
jgi:hypothetical protein